MALANTGGRRPRRTLSCRPSCNVIDVWVPTHARPINLPSKFIYMMFFYSVWRNVRTLRPASLHACMPLSFFVVLGLLVPPCSLLAVVHNAISLSTCSHRHRRWLSSYRFDSSCQHQRQLTMTLK